MCWLSLRIIISATSITMAADGCCDGPQQTQDTRPYDLPFRNNGWSDLHPVDWHRTLLAMSAPRSQRTFKLVNLSAPSQNRAWLNSLSWSMGKQIKCLEAVPDVQTYQIGLLLSPFLTPCRWIKLLFYKIRRLCISWKRCRTERNRHP